MANLIYRVSQTPTIPGASSVKSAPLTNLEIDSNFKALDADLVTAIQAITTKAAINSPALAGTPTAPTAVAGTSTTQIATTEFVKDGTLTVGVSGIGLTASSTTFSANQTTDATITVTSNATSANTINTIVSRDGDGNFAAGTVTVTNLDSSSDRNLKDNIVAIANPMVTLNQIVGVGFTWRGDGTQSYGVIAQQIEKVLPELVSQTDNGLAVSYIPLIAFLIEAVKQQEKRLAVLESAANNR